MLLCGFASSVYGQIYFLNENFSTGTGQTPPSGWTNNTLSGDPSYDKWVFNNPYPRTLNSPITAPAAIFDSDKLSGSGGYEDVTLESPVFNTTGYSTVILQFDQYFLSGYGGTCIVEVWDGSAWKQVYYNTSTTTDPNSQKINISTVAGNKTGLKVRFRWQGDYSWYWIVDNVQVLYNPDVMVEKVVTPSARCGLADDSVRVSVKNNSIFAITNIPVTVNLGGLFSGTATKTISNLAGSSSTVVAFKGGSTLSGGTVTVKAFTAAVGDINKNNDTANYSFTAAGTPQPPTVTAGSNCGPGNVKLSASPQLSTDSIAWYNNSSALGAPLATTRAFTTPFINSTTTYYAIATRGGVGAPNSLATITTSGNAQQGIMFDVTPSKDMLLDSLSLYLTTTYTTTGAYVFRVYYKTGTYLGSETNAGAWTTNGDYNATFSSTGYLPFNINDSTLTSGQTYGIYIYIASGPGTSMDYTTLGSFTTYSNADVSIYCGHGIGGLFGSGSTFSPRGFNGKIHYKFAGCPSSSVAVNATINPTASGTTISPRPGSKGFFKTGNLIDPDINASPDAIQYDIIVPTGFANSAYGATWTISSTTVKTLGGATVPTSMYSTTNPTSTKDAGISLNTDSTYNDSTIKISYVVKRLDNGCDTTINRYVHIAPRPHAIFTYPNICEGDKTTFDNYSVVQSGVLTYSWNFDNGKTSTDASPTEVLGAARVYNVKLVVTTNYGYKDSLTRPITVYKIPATNFDFTNACEGTPVAFTDVSTLPTGTPTYDWEYGDGSVHGTTQNSSRLYAMPGIYPAKLTVTVNGCANSSTKYVTQAPRAVPAYNYSALTCDNNNVVFTNNSTAPSFGSAAYTWNFGDFTEATAYNTSHTYGAFRSYDVTLTASTNLGCVDSSTQTITLLESPIADFTTSGAACTGDAISFVNSSTVPTGTTVTYAWDFGDANQSNLDNPTHQFAGPGTNTVKLVALSTNGCEGTKEVNVTVNLKPIGDFVVNDVCQGDSTVFTNNSSIADNSALTYAWDLDEGKTSANTNTTVTYTTAGPKTISLIITSANGCTDSVSKVANVNPVPVVDVLSTSNLTQDGKFNFTTNANGAKYLWLFGDGGRDSVKAPQYQYIIDGVYTVKLVVISDKGCVGYNTGTVSVNRLGITPVSNFDGTVKMYPNPGTGNFALEFEGIAAENLVSVAVLNNLGQKVANVNLNNIVNNKIAVDISAMAAGVYFVQVESTNGKAAFKYNLVK
jgi:PKD repeat protein